MYKLIATDMDGTILNSKNQITQYTRDAIENVINKGIHFMFATGRIFGSARVFAKSLGLDSPIIACNGGIIKHSNSRKLIYGKPISTDACSALFELFQKDKQYFHFYGEETFYTTDAAQKSMFFFQWNKQLPMEDQIPVQLVPNPHVIPSKDPIYKIYFHCKDQQERNYYQNVLAQFEDISVTSSWFDNLEICGKDVSKGNAVKYYAQEMGICQNDIMCFGDNHNDISMLEYAGMGVAMKNAEKAAIHAADMIADSNDNDGVAKIIEKLIP